MAIDDILTYIQTNRVNRIPDNEIQTSLLQSGYSGQDIEEAFARLNSKKQSFPLSLRKIFLFVAIALVLFVVGTGGYVLIKNQKSQNQAKSNTSELLSPTVTIIDANVNPTAKTDGEDSALIAYTESADDQTNPYQRVVLYDLNKKHRLDSLAELEPRPNALYFIGSWSPDGRYLPVIVNGISGNSPHILYFYDKKLHTMRVVRETEKNERSTRSEAVSYGAGWLDGERYAYFTDFTPEANTRTIEFIRSNGITGISTRSAEIKRRNKDMEIVEVFSPAFPQAPNSVQTQSIVINGKPFTYPVTGEIVGVSNGQVISYDRPKQTVSPNTSGQLPIDVEEQINAWQQQGLSEEVMQQKILELLNRKGDSTLYITDITTGNSRSMLLSGSPEWYAHDVNAHPTQSVVIVYQRNKLVHPDKERFVWVDFENQTQEVLFERPLTTGQTEAASGSESKDEGSFSITADGQWIVREFGDVFNQLVILAYNFDTRQEHAVCEKKCTDLRVYNPKRLRIVY